jgi:glycosyltransferase involved in cell wall biosynthesis
MKVLYFGTYIADYSRNSSMIAALRSAGVEVVECNVPLWTGIQDRVQSVSGGWGKPRFWLRVFGAYFRLFRKYFQLKPHFDILIIGYPGQFDALPAWLLARFSGKPLVWDVFMSIYLIACERGLDQKNRFIVNLIRGVERNALRLPNLLIQDTSQYVEWQHSTHGVSPDRFALVPTGANNHIFFPEAVQETAPADDFCVTYHGSYIPNHGLPYILEAARLLGDQPGIRFELIGEGPDLAYCREFAERNHLTNVQFLPWMSKPELVSRLRKASALLGAFGNTPQSLMTVQNKIFEGMALGKLVISGDSPAVRQAFENGVHLWLCDRNHPADLAQAVLSLYRDPALREAIGRNALQLFQSLYTVEQLGVVYQQHLVNLLKQTK